MALADAGAAAQGVLQQIIKQRLFEQEAQRQAQLEAQREQRADRTLGFDEARFEETTGRNRRLDALAEAELDETTGRNRRLDDAAAATRAFTEGNILAEQIPGGTFLPEDDPTAQKLPGYLRTRVDPRPAMGPDFTGPLPGGETPPEAQVGRPGGFLKTRTQNQKLKEDELAATLGQGAQAQANADRAFQQSQANANRAQVNADRSFDFQANAQARAEQKQGAELGAKAQQAVKERSALAENAQQTLATIDQLLDPKGNLQPGVGWVVGFGGPLMGKAASLMGGSRASDKQAALDRLSSRMIVDLIMQMKAASQTGATGFGQLSEKEGAILSAAAAQLQQSQSEKQFARSLQEVKASVQRVLNAAQSDQGLTVDDTDLSGGEAARVDELLRKYGGG